MSMQKSPHIRVPDLKPGQYSDGSPLDEVQYLECKLIIKSDRFTAAKVFFKYERVGGTDGEGIRN
jgi:hypothetical protein